MVHTRKRQLATITKDFVIKNPIKKRRSKNVVPSKKQDKTLADKDTTISETNVTNKQLISLSSFVKDVSWLTNLQDIFNTTNFKQIEKFLNNEWSAGKTTYPPNDLIFEAFNKTPFDKVKVVLLGQDPYHDDGQAHGLAFSVPRTMATLPPSLKNIFKELANDIKSFQIPNHGCLEKWAESGILLLNTSLTVEPHLPNSHSRIGWTCFTDDVIKLLSTKRKGLVFLLWGGFAHAKEKLIDQTKHTIIKTAHPSPLSFNKFSNCKCFSQVNAALEKYGEKPIDWSL